jgi:3-dehydroquinate synthase
MAPCAVTPETGQSLTVALGPRSYEIRVVSGQHEAFGAFVRRALEKTWGGGSRRTAFLVTDAHLAKLGAHLPLAESLAAAQIEPAIAVIPAGEPSKSLEQAARLYDNLVDRGADRHTVVVAVGGGVVGDLAGFVSATFARGLALVMVPTTLLAQVDSAIGGKVGINHPRAKNIIGAFHQPVLTWIDIQTLETLPDRELRCGLAEVVKYGVILDALLFASLEQNAARLLARDEAALRSIVFRSCELKAGVVAEDEREESGRRAVLNFGHTVGHAIEAVAGYDGPFEHGEAVAAGMVAECRLAQRLGWIGADVTDRVARLLEQLGLPIETPALDPALLLQAMRRDKKNRGGKLRFVLPRAIGSVELTDLAGEADVAAVLAGEEARTL